MDGTPALHLWDLVTEVLHSSLAQPRARGKLCRDIQSEKRSKARTKKDNFNPLEHPGLTSVDHVTANAKLSHIGALLYIWEDNESR